MDMRGFAHPLDIAIKPVFCTVSCLVLDPVFKCYVRYSQVVYLVNVYKTITYRIILFYSANYAVLRIN
jgi:hypothetical protein